MTPEAQQKAIAEACGYYLISDVDSDCVALRGPDINLRGPWERSHNADIAWKEGAPDYLNDLNAMHEAEIAQADAFHSKYGAILFKIIFGYAPNPSMLYLTHELANRLYSATSRQRAEAFVRTIGQWDDSK